MDLVLQLGQNENLHMKYLTLKVTVLMAMTSAGRASEIHKLNPQYMSNTGQEIKFQFGSLTKTSHPGKPSLTFTFKKFGLDTRLDVVSCIEIYTLKTAAWRLSSCHQLQDVHIY